MNYPNELVEAVKAVADAINGEGGGGGSSESYNITFDLNGALGFRILFMYGESIEKIYNLETDYKYTVDVSSNITLPIPKSEDVCAIMLDDGTTIQGNYELVTIEEEDWVIIEGDCTIKGSEETPD